MTRAIWQSTSLQVVFRRPESREAVMREFEVREDAIVIMALLPPLQSTKVKAMCCRKMVLMLTWFSWATTKPIKKVTPLSWNLSSARYKGSQQQWTPVHLSEWLILVWTETLHFLNKCEIKIRRTKEVELILRQGLSIRIDLIMELVLKVQSPIKSPTKRYRTILEQASLSHSDLDFTKQTSRRRNFLFRLNKVLLSCTDSAKIWMSMFVKLNKKTSKILAKNSKRVWKIRGNKICAGTEVVRLIIN